MISQRLIRLHNQWIAAIDPVYCLSYPQKAIQESDTEWSQNKKVVDLSKKDIRHSVSILTHTYRLMTSYQGQEIKNRKYNYSEQM